MSTMVLGDVVQLLDCSWLRGLLACAKDAYWHLIKTTDFFCIKISGKWAREGGVSVLSYNEVWVYYELRKVLLF